MLYFAYCTLLDTDEMQKYCPAAEPTEVASLAGYKVAFSRYAQGASGGGCDLTEAPDDEVLGLLYSLSPEILQDLDSIAGVDKGFYRKIDIRVATEGGKMLDAITYVVPDPLDSFHPSPAYTRPILAGAKALGFPAAYIEKLETTIRTTQEPA
jgi:gamma-glutamylcyclotransferase (GGCT)/AIG2-like uncharacterized protein YtfP